ncbi:hypothetical protein HDU76_000255 [Blyttiomyces sp. JEL0837]|nr:hypothetical protein HDU76_000255 [Blyttiomyces sp. JEL0837]
MSGDAFCLQLTRSVACDSWDGLYLDYTKLQASNYPGADASMVQSDYDGYILNISSKAWFPSPFNSSVYFNVLQCLPPGADLHSTVTSNLRYPQSFFCSKILAVDSSPSSQQLSGCSQNLLPGFTTPPLLCSTPCNAYVDSLIRTLTPFSTCLGLNAEALATVGSTLRGYCASSDDGATTSPIAMDGGGSDRCFAGNSLEAANCGFADAVSASTYCQSNSRDQCCSYSSSGSSTTGVSSKGFTSHSPTVVTTVIVLLALIAAIIIGVVVIVCCRRRRTSKAASADVDAKMDDSTKESEYGTANESVRSRPFEVGTDVEGGDEGGQEVYQDAAVVGCRACESLGGSGGGGAAGSGSAGSQGEGANHHHAHNHTHGSENRGLNRGGSKGRVAGILKNMPLGVFDEKYRQVSRFGLPLSGDYYHPRNSAVGSVASAASPSSGSSGGGVRLLGHTEGREVGWFSRGRMGSSESYQRHHHNSPQQQQQNQKHPKQQQQQGDSFTRVPTNTPTGTVVRAAERSTSNKPDYSSIPVPPTPGSQQPTLTPGLGLSGSSGSANSGESFSSTKATVGMSNGKEIANLLTAINENGNPAGGAAERVSSTLARAATTTRAVYVSGDGLEQWVNDQTEAGKIGPASNFLKYRSDGTPTASYVVIKRYQAVATDEVDVDAGDFVTVDTIYSDGWCHALNERTRMAGFIPYAILMPAE